ncbi:MAG: thioredoxin family protein [Chitinophagaceae bacterium]|jgi:thiol-disulfide isomerase/thioredoxin|nr:thioredoxin family protein [Chitinophagaceae bacterium]
MKQLIFILSMFIMVSGAVHAQTKINNAPYTKDSSLLDFKLILPDSSVFTKASLRKNKPVIIVYYNPDCSHCQATAAAFQKKMSNLSKDVQMLWVTYLAPFDEIISFEKQYGFDKYKNIHFGKDADYIIPSFFQIEYTPFVAAYNKDWQLVKTWQSHVDIDELMNLYK